MRGGRVRSGRDEGSGRRGHSRASSAGPRLGMVALVAALLWVSLAPSAVAEENAAAKQLRIAGSGTLLPIVEGLAKAFGETHPGVSVQIESRGSSSGPPALLAERADLAAMSRPFNDAERQAFLRRHGDEPRRVVVAIDAVAVFVNEDNPLRALTLGQVDAIFSDTRRCGAPKALEIWNDVGVGGKLDGRRIRLFGRNQRSGTRAWFREAALCGGLFRPELRERPGADSLALSIAESATGIGYGSLAVSRAPGVRPIPLARRAGEKAVLPESEHVDAGAYPLTRELYLYASPAASEPVIADFLALAVSERGQQIAEAAGFFGVR